MLSPLTPPTNSNEVVTFMHLTVFPNGGMRILSAMIHLVGSSILAYCVARRIKTVRATSVNELKALAWPRVCVMLILVISWLFVIGAGILIHGIGMAASYNACSAGIFLCIWLYAISKVLIYAFLIEKVRVVWDVVAQPRLTSPVYIVCLLVVIPFCGVPILMVVGRIAFFREDMSCVIGLKPFSSLTLLIYDLCMNVFLNSMFLWPLLRSKLINPRLRAVARRTLVAAAAALAISIINIAILTAMKHQLGWVCLGSCGIDVTLNAVIIFWVTMPMNDSPAAQVQQSASYTKPGSDLPQAPAMTNSTILFSHQEAAQASSASATVLKPPGMMHQQSPQAHDLRHVSVLQELPRFPDPPTEPSPSSEDVSMPLPAVRVKDADERPSLSSNTQGSIHWLRKLLGLPAKRDKDMEVYVSVVTQQGVEMRALENGQVKQGDGKSMDRVKLRSGWVK